MEVPLRNIAPDRLLHTLSASLRREPLAMQVATLPATCFNKPPCATREVHLLQFAGLVEAARSDRFAKACQWSRMMTGRDSSEAVWASRSAATSRPNARTASSQTTCPRIRRCGRTNLQWITGYFTSTLSGSLSDRHTQRADKKDRRGGFWTASRQRQIFA